MFDLKSARHWAEALAREKLCPGMRAVDATMGNGGDTQRLCELVGEEGRVWAFDVQPGAVERTRARLEQAGLAGRATLLQVGHERMAEFVPQPVDLIVFNLGWLPGGDKTITTRVDTTLRALQTAIDLLKPAGLLTVCVYPGHPEGDRELKSVFQWAESLPPGRFCALRNAYVNQPKDPPQLLAVQRLS